jgi:uncharacterized membrane protein YgcG
LLIVYAAGNYFVVRELSVNMMQLDLSDGQDIPFAWIFYILTVVVPVGYLYVAIKKKDLVLLRASLVAVAFSVFTFKYYFSLGHPEITLTISGAVLLAVSLSLFRYLKTPKHGYTRESILKEKWTNANIEGFVFSQTLGGNKSAGGEPVEAGAGGTSTGGGASDAW